MSLAPNSSGFGAGAYGQGMWGDGPWYLFPNTPQISQIVEEQFQTTVRRFEDQSERRYLLSRDRGLTLQYNFGLVDSSRQMDLRSWFIAIGGPFSRFRAVDHQTGVPYIVQWQEQGFGIQRGAGPPRFGIGPVNLKVVRNPSYLYEVSVSSPLAFWTFNDTGVSTAVDAMQSSGGNHGVLVAGASLGQPGAISWVRDTAVRFNGTSGWIRTGSMGQGDVFTIEGWMRRTSATQTTNHQILYAGAGAGGAGPRLTLSPAGAIEGWSHDVQRIVVGTDILDDENWHHVGWTKNGATNRVYVDGDDVTGTITNATIVSITSGSFGGAILRTAGTAANTVAAYNGLLQAVSIHGRALSAQEIRVHYLCGRALT